jgi:excisionase family DNA binding protein
VLYDACPDIWISDQRVRRVEQLAMGRSEDNAVDRARLNAVLGSAPPRYLTVAEAARASGFSPRAVYRAIDRGELTASHVCSRLRIHPDDFLAWMDGDRDATPTQPSASGPAIGTRKTPASNGLRSLLDARRPAA